MAKKLKNPDESATKRDSARTLVEAVIEEVPLAGIVTKTFRKIFPSKLDQQIAQFHRDVPIVVNSHSDALIKQDVAISEMGIAVDQHADTLIEHDTQLASLNSTIHRATPDETHFDGELNGYKELINDGRSATAYEMIKRQYGSAEQLAAKPASVSSRAKSLMAFCEHHAGNDGRAALLFEEAYQLDPSSPKAISNRAFGMILDKRFGDAWDYADTAIGEHADNANLQAMRIVSHALSKRDGDPFDAVPTNIAGTEEVRGATLQWHRWRNDPSWKQLARAMVELYPASIIARSFAAEADLDDIVAVWPSSQRQLTSDEVARVRGATEELRAIWDKSVAAERDIGETEISTLHNMTLGYTMLGERSSIAELITRDPECFQDRGQLTRMAAAAVSETDDTELLDELLDRGFDNDFDIRMERLLRTKDWAAARDLLHTGQDNSPDLVLPALDALEGCIDIMLMPECDRPEALKALFERAVPEPHNDMTIMRFADLINEKDVSDAAFARASTGIEATSPFDLCSTIAFEAMKRHSYGTVIDVLLGRVDINRRSSERRQLAYAFANVSPARQEGVKFFRDLRKTDDVEPDTMACEGYFQMSRRCPNLAVAPLRAAIKDEPTEPRHALLLWQALIQSKQQQAADRFVGSINLRSFSGSAEDRVDLAHLVVRSGNSDAFEYAYEIAATHREDAGAATKYAGLFFHSMTGGVSIPLPTHEVVEQGAWVLFADENGHEWSCVVDEDDSLPGHRSAVHAMVAAAMGRKVGETFEMTSGFVPVVWTVKVLKPKLLHLFHDITASFQEKFPEARAFQSVTMKENDIEPVLRQIRERSEWLEGVAKEYRDRKLPLGFAGRVIGGTSIEFGQFLAQRGGFIVNATGYNDTDATELSHAAAVNPEAGVVLDSYTAWYATATGLLPVLKELFGELIIPRSADDELGKMREALSDPGEGSMTIAWDGTNYIRSSIELASVEANRERIDRQRIDLETFCSFVGTELGTGLSPELVQTLDVAGASLDAVVVAHREGLPLLSADFHLREWAHGLFNVESFGLRGCLRLALKREILTRESVNSAVKDMAVFSHQHLPISADTLLHVFENDETEKLQEFAAIARYIGVPGADSRSHVYVAAAFVSVAWRGGLNLRAQQAVSILFRAVTRLDGATPSRVLGLIVKLAGSDRTLFNYTKFWQKGHFVHDLGSPGR